MTELLKYSKGYLLALALAAGAGFIIGFSVSGAVYWHLYGELVSDTTTHVKEPQRLPTCFRDGLLYYEECGLSRY